MQRKNIILLIDNYTFAKLNSIYSVWGSGRECNYCMSYKR